MELAHAVRDARVRDTKLRDEAARAVKGAYLNIAEAAARGSRADQARAFAIARAEAEAMEAVAAVEIASVFGDTSVERVYGLLTGLIR